LNKPKTAVQGSRVPGSRLFLLQGLRKPAGFWLKYSDDLFFINYGGQLKVATSVNNLLSGKAFSNPRTLEPLNPLNK